MNRVLAAPRSSPSPPYVDALLGSNKDEGTFFVRPGGAADAYVKDVRQRFGDMAEPI